MAKLSINLLPVEYTQVYASTERFRKIQSTGIGILVLLIFLSTLTFVLNWLQNSNILQANTNLQAKERQVSQFKSQEESLVLLKDRLNTLQKISTTPSRSNAMYNLIATLMPASLIPTLIVTDTVGNISLTLITSNSTDVDNFVSDLVNPQRNNSLVEKVEVDNLSRGKDGVYRINLKIISQN